MAEDYGYLNNVSKEVEDFIIKRVEEGKLNLYNSIMSVLGYRMKSGEFTSDLDTEREYYKKKNEKKLEDIEDKEFFDKLYEQIFLKFQSNRLRDNGSPIPTKDERLVAKGAMIMALRQCKVSEKNIDGMLGVLEEIMRSKSAFEIKKAYQDYSKHF